MSCAECLALSGAYIDDVMDPADRAPFDLHIDRCPACARYVRVLRKGLQLVQDLPSVQPSPDFRIRLHRRLHGLAEERRAQALSVQAGATVTIALAATFAMVAFLPAIGARQAERGTAAAEVPSARADLAAVDGAGLVSRLPNAWNAYVRPSVAPPPSMTAALPGPYSPLVVQSPRAGASTGLALLTAYIAE